VCRYLDKCLTGGVAGLLRRDHKGGPTPTLAGADHAAFVEQLRGGQFRRAKEAQAWIKARTQTTLVLSRVHTLLGKAGGVLQVPRKTHAKIAAASAGAAGAVRLWVLDEHRYGRLPVIRRCWGLRGVRGPGALRHALPVGLPARGARSGRRPQVDLLFTPAIDQDIQAVFLRQIGESDPAARHLIIQDQAGFHRRGDDPRLPANVRLVPLPPYSPELNPVERLGDLVKDAICNRLFKERARWRMVGVARSASWAGHSFFRRLS
jgi:hypothetical protein